MYDRSGITPTSADLFFDFLTHILQYDILFSKFMQAVATNKSRNPAFVFRDSMKAVDDDRGMILPVPVKSRPPLKALKRKQMVYEVVQAEVKSYILEHGLKAGDPLPPETDLAQQLNVSRNSVREAV